MSAELRETVKSILTEELGDLLADVSWRMRQAYGDGGQIPAEALNLSTHMLTGYVTTNNSPAAGSIAWTDLHVVYQGVDYGPFAADTAMTYVWFDADHATQKIQTSNTKPVLTKDDAIIFVNNGGVVIEVLKSQLVSGALLIDGSVNSGELAAAAVTAAKIFDGAVSTTKLADDAVTVAKIGPAAVDATALAANAVTDAKLAANAVTTTKLATGAVTDVKIGTGAVTTLKIGDLAVAEGKLAAGAVTTTKIGDTAITSVKLADDAVTQAKIASGAVGDTEVQVGGISTSKLNLLQHLVY